jgi:hypothetical protein
MNAPIFTRYLYYEPDVVNSLLTSVLKKQPERAIFWAYELYFSGLEAKLFRLLSLLYKKYYAPVATKKWGVFLEGKLREWADNRWMHSIVATIVHTMALRPSLLDPLRGTPQVPIYYIHYSEKDIEPYITIRVSPDVRPYRILQKVCLYSTEKNADMRGFDDILEDLSVSKSEEIESILDDYFYHWEYYSFFTPIWKERIEKYGGKIDDETKSVIFLKEELEEKFYGEYGYEPDEQPAEIKERIMPDPLFV